MAHWQYSSSTRQVPESVIAMSIAPKYKYMLYILSEIHASGLARNSGRNVQEMLVRQRFGTSETR